MIKPFSIDLSVDVGGLTLRNPVMPASGTFAEGLDKVIDFNRLGAFVTKTVTRELRAGNPLPRVVERPGSLINAIGIPSKGVPHFIEKIIPQYATYEPPLVVSISAPTAEGFASLAAELTLPGVSAIEANISCPNIEEDGKAFAMRAGVRREGHASVARCHQTAALGQAYAQYRRYRRSRARGGSGRRRCGRRCQHVPVDGDRSQDIQTVSRQRHGRTVGTGDQADRVAAGVSMRQGGQIPIIGCGGISTAEDAIEYMLAGATAVQVGTATFLQPAAMIDHNRRHRDVLPATRDQPRDRSRPWRRDRGG